MKRLPLVLIFAAAGLALDLPPTGDVLRMAGKAVEQFWVQYPAVNCTEMVTQTKLEKGGKVALKKDSTFDYLVLLRQTDGDLLVEESRVNSKPEGKAETAPLLVTNGFSTLLLIFHPRFQHSYEFSTPEWEGTGDSRAMLVRFRQSHNVPSPSCLRLRQRDYPLEWRGTAWIDPGSGSVMKIDAELNTGMEDVGLKELRAEVVYAPVRFSDGGPPQWLPSAAIIEAETPLQHWKNSHRFTNYRRFTVETTTKTEMPK